MRFSLAMSSLPKFMSIPKWEFAWTGTAFRIQVLLELIAGRDACMLGSRSAKLCLKWATAPR